MNNKFIWLCVFLSAALFFVVHKNVETVDTYQKTIEMQETRIKELEEDVLLYQKLAKTQPRVVVAKKHFVWDDLYLLARLVESEAGNQDFETKMKVASVVMNRVGSPNYPDTIKDVIYQSGQFSVTFGPNPMIDWKVPSVQDFEVAHHAIMNGSSLPHYVLYFFNSDLDNEFTRSVSQYCVSGNLTFAMD